MKGVFYMMNKFNEMTEMIQTAIDRARAYNEAKAEYEKMENDDNYPNWEDVIDREKTARLAYEDIIEQLDALYDSIKDELNIIADE